MLRIFIFEEPFSVKLRLEGELTSQTVPVLTQHWEDVRSRLQGRKAILDLGDLVDFDEAGRSTLRWLTTSGARLGYANGNVRPLVDEFSQEAAGFAGFASRIWKQLRTAASKRLSQWQESALYRRICAALPVAVRPCGSRAA